MITKQLLDPKSIVIVGGSNDVTKPGGKVVKNLIDYNYSGKLYVVNPKNDEIQGIKTHKQVEDLPQCDLAVLAIAAKFCPHAVEVLASQKGTKAFIILSAGFQEESEEGAKLERQIVDIVNAHKACLIGPNCIGMMNANHTSVFMSPIPKFEPQGADFITGSGATAVFILENAVEKGLKFNSVYSVGNSAQIGVEEVLEYLDETFDPNTSSRVKLLYLENISNPQKMLKHASSLIRKGCKIAAIKAGTSDAGSRAASSHTGALASPDVAVDALFKKAGIVRCYGRDELSTVAGIFMHKPLEGNRIAIVTHAGGPAVMLTDALSNSGMEVPALESPELLAKLFAGSSVANPIDFLATGTAEQLGYILDACENDFDNIDGVAVIFGSPGLTRVFDVYELLNEKMKTCKKPIYPILPSIVNVKEEIEYFISLGRINFPEEVVFGKALGKVYHTPKPVDPNVTLPKIDTIAIRKIIDESPDGYLHPNKVQGLFDAAGIPRVGEAVVNSAADAVKAANQLGYPVVMKVVGPVHKSDVGGVVLNVDNDKAVEDEFNRMIKIKDTTAIMLQPMISGHGIYVGAKKEDKFGHMVLCGLGGIYIEVLKDVVSSLAPIDTEEAMDMIKSLKTYDLIKGVRGQEGVNQEIFAEVISRVSALCLAAPEIAEMDINPLLGNAKKVTAVDARIRIEK